MANTSQPNLKLGFCAQPERKLTGSMLSDYGYSPAIKQSKNSDTREPDTQLARQSSRWHSQLGQYKSLSQAETTQAMRVSTALA